MKTLNIFWEIASLRASPETLKISKQLLLVSLATNLFISVLINLKYETFFTGVMLSLLECTTVIALTITILFYVKKSERIQKTLAALMGVGAIIGFFGYLVITLVPTSHIILFRPVILVWNLSATAKILAYSIDIRFSRAFFVAIGYALCLWQILTFFYPIITA